MVGGKAPLLFFLWYGEKLSLFPALRDDIPKLDDRLHDVLLELKGTEEDAVSLGRPLERSNSADRGGNRLADREKVGRGYYRETPPRVR